MSRLKTSGPKSAKTHHHDKNKKRKKKPTPRRRSSASSSSSSTTPSASTSTTTSSAAALHPSSPPPSTMKNSASSVASTSPTSGTPTSAKECEQCGNPSALEVSSSAKAVANGKKIAAAANTGCQICDFVAYCKAQRHCVQCDRTHCDFFCEWCGQGFHAKCAKARGESVDAAAGFCCKKCEAEQADDDDDDDDSDGDGEAEAGGSAKKVAEANDVNAKCGECQLPFNTSAESVPAVAPTSSSSSKAKQAKESESSSGFKVNQSVLVENDEVLYNAVITDVDAKKERIKIHFLRWSKSFDNWYAMDDERINESLACDCCNRWFHIGCLPPIKSSGRFKDTTYVCPTCLDDAKGFYNGTRSTALPSINRPTKATANSSSSAASSSTGASSSSSSRRRATAIEDPPVTVSTSKKRSSKPVVESESEEEEGDENGGVGDEEEEETKTEERSKKSSSSSSKSKKPSEATVDSTVVSRKRRRSDSGDSVGSTASASAADKKAKGSAASSTKKTESSSRSKPSSSSSSSSKKSRSRSGSREDADADDGHADTTTSSDNATSADAVKEPRSTSESSTKEDPGASEEKTRDDASPSSPSATDPKLSMDKPLITRKVSGHSMSSLLNSPSSPPQDEARNSPALRSQSTAPSTSASVRVKVEKDPLALPAPASKKRPNSSKVWVTGRDAKTAKAAVTSAPGSGPSSSSSTATSSARGSLSAFDILREVAAQSMSDDLPPAPPAAAKKAQKSRMTAADRKLKADAARASAAATANDKTSAAHGRAPPLPPSTSPPLNTHLGVGIPMNSFVDLHFAIRKEMYLRICMLEDERLLERETAQVLRAMIYPTSDKFHDLKFVYVVNKDLSSLQLTKRLLELVPVTAGGTAPTLPAASFRPSLAGPAGQAASAFPPSLLSSSRNSSAAPSPVRRSTPSPAPESVDSGGPEPEPETKPTPFELFSSLEKPKPLTSYMVNITAPPPSTETGAASPMTPLLPPPVPTKTLMETMFMHSKLPTLLPPPAPSSAAQTSTLTAPSASSSVASSPGFSTTATITTTTTTVPAEPAVPLVNNISPSISSN